MVYVIRKMKERKGKKEQSLNMENELKPVQNEKRLVSGHREDSSSSPSRKAALPGKQAALPSRQVPGGGELWDPLLL